MKKNLSIFCFVLIVGTTWGQQYGVEIAPVTVATPSPGFVFSRPGYVGENFNYAGQYLNLYGSGFHSFDDQTSIGGVNAYVSSYFGIDFFTAGQRRFRINANGNAFFDQNVWMNKGATISSDFPDSDANNSWSTNLSVRNNNGAINTFSRLAFVSESGGFGAITVKKTGEFTGDMFFQVRNGPGYYRTPLSISSNGNVGISGNTSVAGDLEIGRGDGNDTKLRFHNFTAGWYSMGLDMSDGKFKINSGANLGDAAHFTMDWNGNVGIGTESLDAKLTVKGDIHTREVRVDLTGAVGPDYVFEKDYDLLSLIELETYINQNKHLPEVPSAKEMEANGLNLKEMNLLLLKKVEELTLHLIDLKKENKSHQDQLNKQQLEIKKLTERIYEKN